MPNDAGIGELDDDAMLTSAHEYLHAHVNGTDVLAIGDDFAFGAAWDRLTDDERAAIGTAGFTRIRKARPWVLQTTEQPVAKGAAAIAASKAGTGFQLRSVGFEDYVESFRAADYVLDGVLQAEHVYALTALTGHGKTAVATTLNAHLTGDRNLGGREVQRGLKALLLSGENDEDQKARSIATAQQFGLWPAGDRLRVISGSYPIARAVDEIRRDDMRHGPYGIVSIDTSISFFGGDDENNNLQLREHAAGFRELTQLPGRPVVVVLCHPVKNATRDNLIPRGGGAFLNEIDGNLTVWREGDRLTLHTAGKFRGAVFDPIHFVLKPVELDGIVDSKGRPVRSVVAAPVDETEVEQLAKADWNDENRLLYAMLQGPDDSIRAWARACTWTTAEGEPHASKVHRLLKQLEADKLVQNSRGRWALSSKGKTEAERCK